MLEHLHNPFALFKKIRNSLITGGWALISVPIIDGWQFSFFRSRWGQLQEVPRHLFIPSSEGMISFLKRSGFENIKVRYSPTLELAVDSALSIWPRGNYYFTACENVLFRIVDRLIVGCLISMFFIPIYFLRILGMK